MDAKTLRKEFEQRGLKKVKVGGFDVDGVLRGKYISLDKFWSAAESGFGFCDVIFGWDVADALYEQATLTGWHTGYPDAVAKIDLNTFRVLPLEPDTAHFLVDFYLPDGRPHPACPRNLLKRVIERANRTGYLARFGAEFEFWLFRESVQTLHQKSFRDLETLSPGMFGYSWIREAQQAPLAHDILETLAAYRVPVEGLHTETGPGVWEAALHYTDALEAADQAALFKTTMKQLCARHGIAVTFMAKWSDSLPGSSGHLHQSLWSLEGTKNVFSEEAASDGLSDIARKYVAGQVHRMAELTALHAPFVNSYKRYVPGMWAPMTATWGIDNRTCSVRVLSGEKPAATRVEYRQTAADINPYIAIATCLGAGLHGIEQKLELPPATEADATAANIKADRLPDALPKAIELLRNSRHAKDILGAEFIEHYCQTRDWEVRQFAKSVTDWELRRYFETV